MQSPTCSTIRVSRYQNTTSYGTASGSDRMLALKLGIARFAEKPLDQR